MGTLKVASDLSKVLPDFLIVLDLMKHNSTDKGLSLLPLTRRGSSHSKFITLKAEFRNLAKLRGERDAKSRSDSKKSGLIIVSIL